MNTHEARSMLRALAQDALPLVERIGRGEPPTLEERQYLRSSVVEARTALTDAGYPGEAVWRALSRTSMGLETALGAPNPDFWQDVLDELRLGLGTLDALLTVDRERDADLPLIG